MEALIVEDDAFKAKQVEQAIRETMPRCAISHASSLQEATHVLREDRFDFVVLDMAIPSHSGEGGSADVYSQPIGGLDILLYLAFDKRAERVMVLTQYPTVEYNREHISLSKLKSRLEIDGVLNLCEIALFSEDGKWKARLVEFLRSAA